MAGNVNFPKLKCENCKLTKDKCDSSKCPETVAGFSAFEVYGPGCRYKCR